MREDEMNKTSIANSLRRLENLDQWWKSDFRVLKCEIVDKRMRKIQKMDRK